MDIYLYINNTQVVKTERVRCLSHVSRIPKQTHARKVLLDAERDRKMRGRSRKKWLKATKEDLRRVGIQY